MCYSGKHPLLIYNSKQCRSISLSCEKLKPNDIRVPYDLSSPEVSNLSLYQLVALPANEALLNNTCFMEFFAGITVWRKGTYCAISSDRLVSEIFICFPKAPVVKARQNTVGICLSYCNVKI